MTALDLAYYIRKKAREKRMVLSKKKLQKLLYYVQGYFLKEFRVPAFPDEFEHWEDGPVVSNVYRVQTYEESFFYSDRETPISKNLIRLVDDVLESTKDLTSEEIIQKTHSEDPWKNHNTVYNEKIPKEDILKYFDKNDPLNLKEFSSKHILSETEKRKIYNDILLKRSNLYKELAKV